MKFKIEHSFYSWEYRFGEEKEVEERYFLYVEGGGTSTSGWVQCGKFQTKEDAIKFAQRMAVLKEPDLELDI